MKVKLLCKKENYETFKEMLEAGGYSISNDANLTFKEDNYQQETFIGEHNSSFEIIHYNKIIFIESFGHEIKLHTKEKSYSIREKLYEAEGILNDKSFVRINKSQVTNIEAIKQINPTFNSKIILLMKNDESLIVTRNYAPNFKRSIGL